MFCLSDSSKQFRLQYVQRILSSTARSESLDKPSSLVCRIRNKGSDIEGLFLTQLDPKEVYHNYILWVYQRSSSRNDGSFHWFLTCLTAARKASSNSTLDSSTTVYMKMPGALPSCPAWFTRFFGTSLGTFSSEEESIFKRKADNKCIEK